MVKMSKPDFNFDNGYLTVAFFNKDRQLQEESFPFNTLRRITLKRVEGDELGNYNIHMFFGSEVVIFPVKYHEIAQKFRDNVLTALANYKKRQPFFTRLMG